MSMPHAPKPEIRLDTSVEMGTLSAFYGGLLTDRQRQALRLYYEEDYSLGEIAEQLGCTRQSVHELIARSGESSGHTKPPLARRSGCGRWKSGWKQRRFCCKASLSGLCPLRLRPKPLRPCA